LTPPSNVKEITEIELINQRMTLIATIQQLNLFGDEWILKNIMKFSDKEISDISLQKQLQGNNAQPGAEGGGGVAPPMDMGMGGEAPPEIPPEGEAPAGAETPAAETPADLAASTIVNMFGKDFLLENKDDFFNMVKQAKTYNVPTPLAPMFEAASEFIVGALKAKSDKVNRNNIISMMSVNEFKGINFNDRKITIWEKNTENKELDELKEEIIECGIKVLNG
jgi:hypothetical protein